MKTNVINTASENVTSFVINEDMLNEKKALKYISKPNMVAAISDICAAIKAMNSKFSPREYTEDSSKKELFDAYGRFYIIYTDLKEIEVEARHRADEKAEREERARLAEIAKNTKELIKPAQPVKSEEELKEASKANKKAKADKAPKAEKKASVEGEKKSAPRIGDAEARLNIYAEELKLKEILVADEKVAEKYTKEEIKTIRHRIASLKRKIERATKALENK
jgi:valyl-tRNA synthetase